MKRCGRISHTGSTAKLRRTYPPTEGVHLDVLEAYGGAIEVMKAELQKPNRGIDVDALNRADAAARWFALEYWKLHYPQR